MLIRRLQRFRGFGLEFEFAIERHIEKAARKQNVSVGPRALAALWARISRVGDTISGLRILWVDDEPDNNIEEQMLLSQLGAQITSAENTTAALTDLRTRTFDVVISDMKRGEETTAGLTLLAKMSEDHFNVPIIIYTGTDQSDQSRPAGVFGITNTPDELVHLVFDVRERYLTQL
jgi:CheY-like chemotaxis protein